MEAARSGVSLLLGGSVHLHLVDLRWRLRPRVFVTHRAPCAARSGLGTPDLLLLYLFGLPDH